MKRVELICLVNACIARYHSHLDDGNSFCFLPGWEAWCQCDCDGGAKWMTGISGFGRGQFDWDRGGRIW